MRHYYMIRRYASILIGLLLIPLGIYLFNENRNNSLFIIVLGIAMIIYNYLMLQRYKLRNKAKENDLTE